MSAPPRFRFAPTPSRPLHVGSAWAALVGWISAQHQGGQFILRIEDIDRTRSQSRFESELLHDLDWLGLDWDEGPDVGGPHAPYRQSERFDRYDAALESLAHAGHLYACTCSRAEIRQAQSAPHLVAGVTERPYPGTCRPLHPTTTPLAALHPDRGGLRLSLDTLATQRFAFEDGLVGPVTEDVAATCGDVLLGRPGQPTYQLAAVVDDRAMGISHVVRGRDLLGSTARQLALRAAMGEKTHPFFAHHGLVVDTTGQKLSKRDDAAPLSTLRPGGPERLIAALGRAAGYFGPDTYRATARDLRDAVTTAPARLATDLDAAPIFEALR